MSDYDRDKVDEVVLALLHLTQCEPYRAWKEFPWSALDHLYEKGWIADPKNKAKSVVFTEEGLALSAALFHKHFGEVAERKPEREG
jgi:hypothetical protein